nr:MAG TPA: hypothetical protein [Caudoviricetes sp.]
MEVRTPTPAQGFLCEKTLTKSAFKGGRTARGTAEVRPPSKLPLLLGGAVSPTVFQNTSPSVEGDL